MRAPSRLLRGFALALLLLAAPPPAGAQLPVIDPANLAQSVVQAAHMVEQIGHQVQQIRNQAQMLAKNPLQLSSQLSASIGEAQALLARAEGLAFDLRRIGQDLEALYPETWEAYDLAGVLAQSDRWVRESRSSVETALAMQARAAEALAQSQGRIAAALGASAGAEGQTSAVQAGNQLLGVSAAELAEIRALLAAQGRALAIERMERARFQAKWAPVRRPESAQEIVDCIEPGRRPYDAIAREDRAREIQRRAFPNASPAPPPPARTAF